MHSPIRGARSPVKTTASQKGDGGFSGYMRREDHAKGSYSPTKGRARQADQLTTKTSSYYAK